MKTLGQSQGPTDRVSRWGWIHRKDICTRVGEVYLTRWTLLQLFGWALLLHKMHRPDQDRCHHDHPWRFVTLVLWGGYVEEIMVDEGVRTRRNRPGTLLYRPALHTHRVSGLPRGSCWTLVLRGPYQRVWGFRNDRREWRPWDRFVDWAGSVLWCDERRNVEEVTP